MTSNLYLNRRKALAEQLDDNSIALLFAGKQRIRNGDCYYPFRVDSDFYYLTGFDEPDAIVILHKSQGQLRTLICSHPKDLIVEMWQGHRIGQQIACEQYLADQAYPLSEFCDLLTILLNNVDTVYYPFNNAFLQQSIQTCYETISNDPRGQLPHAMINLAILVDEMRLFKDTHELTQMRIAASINREAHTRAMQRCQPGLSEKQLCSELLYVYQQQGCLQTAYEPIVAGGKNACTLHHCATDNLLKDGDLVLVDMGPEYGCYASDVTRTFPVNGHFSEPQRLLYQLVLDTQQAVIDMIRPGIKFAELQQTTVKLLAQGLLLLNLLPGELEHYTPGKSLPFYQHGVSHWLGLDTHDPGQRTMNGQSRLLEAGMVLTVEPGIYIPTDAQQLDAQWRGIGIRIEDNIVVTDTGNDNLTAAIPKTIADIEGLMN